ncbi:MAG TPA: hypothetical protein VK816_03985 [Jatrophihabitantaceae bacterium]|jgi:hypothetical protein|nr:hypothetical protein [Jatrophihabitantaceae bacterium]
MRREATPPGGSQTCAPFSSGELSCCCHSRPAVRVMLPPTLERDHAVDLLLCTHHYRRYQLALDSAGATVFDAFGEQLTPRSRAIPSY